MVTGDEPTQREKPGGEANERSRRRPDRLRRGDVVGRYVILELLGQGGMGVVYAAYDPDLDRKIALKLLSASAGTDGSGGRARLLREAQALGRLAHPNVVAVYDVGDTGDAVWIAMEHVDGPGLKEWLGAERRSWREIVELFRKVGRGLAVAHERGVVHRDVKPDNIFLWRDGRICVGDFGLARVGDGRAEEKLALPDDAALAEMTPLTETGVVMGTPPYMPPEQLRGQPADARSDQFSFCVTLYEALYGERPFEAETMLALREELESGRVREAPAQSSVPAWVRRVLVRGLATDPDQRYPSMAALLDDLGRDPRRSRRRLMTAAGVVGLAAAAVIGVGVAIAAGPETDSALCQSGAAEMAGIWNSERAGAIGEAFRASGAVGAEATWERVRQRLDGYRDDWVAMHRDACEATHVRGVQSPRLLDMRMLCLDRRRVEVDELLALLGKADGELVRRSVEAASSLSDIDRCADITALTGDGTEPATPEQTERINALERELAKARARHRAGRYSDAVERAATIAAEAAKVGYGPFTARAREFLGSMQRLVGEYGSAEATLFEAVAAAAATGADRTAAIAWTELALLVGRDLAHPDRGLRYASVAAAAIERAGSPPRLLAQLHNNRGAVLSGRGKFEAAAAEYQRALAIDEKTLAPLDPERAVTLTSLGTAAYRLGDYAKAREHYERALAIREEAYGPGHPNVAESKVNVGIVLEAQGHFTEALASYKAGLAIHQRVFGDESIRTASSLSSIGGTYHALGRFQDAIDVNRRALAIRLKVLGDVHPEVATNYNNIAIAEKNLGRFDAAAAAYGKAIEILEAGGADSRFGLAVTLNNLGEAARAQGKISKAIPAYQRSLELLGELLAADNPILAHPLTGLGISYLESGRVSRALELLERALAMRQAQKINPVDLADTSFGLARALWRQGRDRERALILARTARDAFAAAGDGRASDRDAVARWLASR